LKQKSGAQDERKRVEPAHNELELNG
jgi:hypothetical protein